MRAPLTIVIPTLNAAKELPDTLGSLLEGVQAGLVRDLIISDGGSTDATLAIAQEAGAVMTRGAAGRGGQLRRGAEQAAGEWLLFLHADTQLAPGWSDAVLDHVAQDKGPAHFRLKYRENSLAARLVAGWANLRSAVFQMPYGDQALLISRADYDEVGGYRDIALMEDVVMARALKGRLQALPTFACTSARGYQRRGWLVQGTRNLWTMVRFLAGANPEKLAREYRSR